MAGVLMRVLHVAAEVFPLVKTGGLADVVAALPVALAQAGADVRLLLPGLPPIIEAVRHARPVADLGTCFGAARVRLLCARMPATDLPVYVIDAPLLYRRAGGPYQARDGQEWPDNLQRFGLLGWVAAQLAAGELDASWRPQVLHSHDWHAAMSNVYLSAHGANGGGPGGVRSVYTVHNLAYQGLFPHEDRALLGLSAAYMSPEGIEYHGQLSFMKAGLKFADRITTVSPTYAREIATHEFGAGLDGVIRERGSAVSGILNGIDSAVWDPARDSAIAARYSIDQPAGKVACKAALQREYGLVVDAQRPLFGLVSRLTTQKGLDLVLAALPALLEQRAQLVVQGNGDAALEAAFRMAAQAHAGAVGVHVGYDENRAHRIFAGCDFTLVASRFEPCGLTQLYSQRYGSLPVVRRVGGLVDTVTDATDATLADGSASGFSFDAAVPAQLVAAAQRAIALWRQPDARMRLMQLAMRRDHSWQGPARQYLDLYQGAAE